MTPTPERHETSAKRAHWFSFHPDIQATLSAAPDNFSPITSRSRMASLRYALAGWLYMLRYQKNVRIQTVATILVFALGLWLGLHPLEWAILVVTITFNWMAEFTNAAIEAAVNVASPQIHPMARVSKDVAAATALLAAVASLIVGALVLGPPLLEKLGPLIAQFIQPR